MYGDRNNPAKGWPDSASSIRPSFDSPALLSESTGPIWRQWGREVPPQQRLSCLVWYGMRYRTPSVVILVELLAVLVFSNSTNSSQVAQSPVEIAQQDAICSLDVPNVVMFLGPICQDSAELAFKHYRLWFCAASSHLNLSSSADRSVVHMQSVGTIEWASGRCRFLKLCLHMKCLGMG